MESTGNYWRAFYDHLTKAGCRVDVINPIVTKASSAGDIRGRKTDKRDALMIADVVFRGNYVSKPAENGPERGLKVLTRQRGFRDSHIRPCNSLDELKENFAGEGDADWLLCPWDGSPEQEEELAKSLRISIRCIPQGEMGVGPEAPCILTGRPTTRRVLWARSY